MTKEEKQAEIDKLYKEVDRIKKQSEAIIFKGFSKYQKVNQRRAVKLAGLMIEFALIRSQASLIRQTPTFESGTPEHQYRLTIEKQLNLDPGHLQTLSGLNSII